LTLVEMLMATLIVGLLMALVITAVMAAVTQARIAAVGAELEDLVESLEAYKARFGDYPTSRRLGTDLGKIQFMNYLIRRFPRHRFTDFDDVRSHVAQVTEQAHGRGLHLEDLDEAEFLVFWLGGLSLSAQLRPLSNDPLDPFTGQSDAPFHEFDATRLVDFDGDGWCEYLPQSQSAPFVYFQRLAYTASQYGGSSVFGLAVPYALAETADGVEFCKAESYQIITAGPDARYGPERRSGRPMFPSGVNFSIEDRDNLVSFASGRLASYAN
jgi:type II secretory pathway pseudopilin PulG